MNVRNVLVAAALALTPLSAHADETSIEAKFYRGYYLETALRDFDGALAAYGEAEKLATGDAEKFLVPTLVAKARCLQAKGKGEEAKALLTRVLEIDPNHVEAKNLLERGDETTKADPELERRLNELITRLGASDGEKALTDLQFVGAVKYPFLANGLRSRDVSIVSGCAVALGKDGSPTALSILREAMLSPEVAFPPSLAAGFRWGTGVERFDLCEIALKSPDESLRSQAVAIGLGLIAFTPPIISPERAVAFVERACQDASPRVLANLVYIGKWNQTILHQVAAPLVAIVPRLDLESRRKLADNIFQLTVPCPALDAWLTSCARDPDAVLRKSSLSLLRNRLQSNSISVDDALERALESLDDPVLEVNSEGLRVLNQIASKLGSPDTSRVTDAAVRALGRWDANQLTVAGDLLRVVGQVSELDVDHFDRLWQALLQAMLRCREDVSVTAIAPLYQSLRTQLGDDQATDFITNRLALIDDEVRQSQVVRGVLNSGLYRGDAFSRFYEAVLLSPHRSVRFEFYARASGSVDTHLSSEAALRNLASDLPQAPMETRKQLQLLVRANPSAILLEPARQYFEEATGTERKGALSTYIACAGTEAVPLLRKIIESNPMDRDAAYPLLISRLGVNGVEDFIAWYRTSLIKLSGTTNNAWSFALNGLVVEGVDKRREFAKRLMESLPVAEWSADLLRCLKEFCGGVEPRLVELGLSSTDPVVIYSTLVIAAEWMPESCEPLIVPFLDSTNPSLVRAAQQALAAIRERRELRSASKLSLSFDRSKATEEARDFLKNDDPVKRRGGALALGALGDVSAIPLLLKLLDDKVPEVREAALTALSKLDSSATNASSSKPTPQKDG